MAKIGKIFKQVARVVSPVANVIVGRQEGRKAEREAGRQAEAQRGQMRQAEAAVRAEQQRTEAQLNATRAKIAQGQARANRARMRGGIFGGAENQPQGIINPRLG